MRSYWYFIFSSKFDLPSSTTHIVGELFFSMIRCWKINGILPTITINSTRCVEIYEPIWDLKKKNGIISFKTDYETIKNVILTQCHRDDNSFELSLLRFCFPVASLQQFRSVGKPWLVYPLREFNKIQFNVKIALINQLKWLTCKWIPSLIFVNEIVLCIGHGIDFSTRIMSFQKNATPSIGIIVSSIVIAYSPHDSTPTWYYLTKMAANLSPKHITQLYNHLEIWKM